MTTTNISNNFIRFVNGGTNYGTLTSTSDGLITLTSNSGNIRIAGATNPVDSQDVATKDYVDTNTSPAGSTSEIQYNNSGSFAASSNFTFDGTNTLTVDNTIKSSNASTVTSTGNPLTITSGNGGSTSGNSGTLTLSTGSTTSGSGGQLTLQTNNGTGTSGEGGSIFINTGSGSNNRIGGFITMTSGNGGPSGNGGNITLFTGDGGSTSGNAGQFNVIGGTTTDGVGGRINLYAGNSQGSGNIVGGSVQILSGNGSDIGSGGSITLTVGSGGSTGDGGNVNITSGEGGSTSGNGGDIVITTGDAGPVGNSGTLTLTTGSITSGTKGNVVSTEITQITDTTDNTGISTGSLQVAGGISVAKNMYLNGVIEEPNRPYFIATKNANQNNLFPSVYNLITFETIDTNGTFASNAYTVPHNGIYSFNVNYEMYNTGSSWGATSYLRFYVAYTRSAVTTYKQVLGLGPANIDQQDGYLTLSSSINLSLQVGDTVEAYIFIVGSGGMDVISDDTQFSGFMLAKLS